VPINGELGVAIRDEQHLFASVVEVVADATVGLPPGPVPSMKSTSS
jgi:hypothetical protein